MARMEDVAYKPANQTQTDTQTNVAAVATAPAPTAGTGKRVYITGYTVSYSVNVAAITSFQIVSGAVTVEKFQVPAGALPPTGAEFDRPFECPAETSAVATLGAGGAANVGTVVLRYFVA